eukprot:4399228-Alexandrium_andersonii.AAC.1
MEPKASIEHSTCCFGGDCRKVGHVHGHAHQRRSCDTDQGNAMQQDIAETMQLDMGAIVNAIFVEP